MNNSHASFGPVSTPSPWSALDEVDHRRAAQWWEFMARERSIDELLSWTECAVVTVGERTLVAWGLEAEGRLPKVWSARVPLDELVRDAAASLTDSTSA